MKKITAAFDGLKFSESTLQYAIDIACNRESLLVGVFLDDFTYHSYKLTDLIGDEGVSQDRVKSLIENDRETRKRSVMTFEDSCKRAEVKSAVHHDKSIALQELIKETIYSDLLIIGAKETLTHHDEELPTRFIRDLLADVQCPVLIAPTRYQKIEQVVLLYDGDPSSVYAAKMLSYMLPELKDLPTEIVSIKYEQSQSEFPQEQLIHEFIMCHYPDAQYNLLEGTPEAVVVDHLETKQNTLVVLGAYRRSMVSRWFKPSMADLLIKKTQLPLFVAHYK